MKRIPLFKLFTTNQDEALTFYKEKLGFEIAEDRKSGDFRWLLVKLPDSEICINLDLAKSEAQKDIVGKQASDQPFFSIETDDCIREYNTMKANGVRFESEPDVQPWGTGVMLNDLYGNKIYLNQEPSH